MLSMILPRWYLSSRALRPCENGLAACCFGGGGGCGGGGDNGESANMSLLESGPPGNLPSSPLPRAGAAEAVATGGLSPPRRSPLLLLRSATRPSCSFRRFRARYARTKSTTAPTNAIRHSTDATATVGTTTFDGTAALGLAVVVVVVLVRPSAVDGAMVFLFLRPS